MVPAQGDGANALIGVLPVSVGTTVVSGIKKPPSILQQASAIWSEVKGKLGRMRRRDICLWSGVLVVAVAIVITLLLTVRIDWAAVSSAIAGFNPVLAIAIMAILPLGGFSISIVYLAVGARFGPVAGLPVVAGVTAFHLLATYWITRSFLRGPLDRFVKKRGYKLPHVRPNEHASVCLLAVLVPGLPYFVRNYLLVLTEVPLRVYFWVCLPAYVARSYVTILLGNLSTDPDGGQLLLLVITYVIKLTICGWIVLRLRRGRHAGEAAPPK